MCQAATGGLMLYGNGWFQRFSENFYPENLGPIIIQKPHPRWGNYIKIHHSIYDSFFPSLASSSICSLSSPSSFAYYCLPQPSSHFDPLNLSCYLFFAIVSSGSSLLSVLGFVFVSCHNCCESEIDSFVFKHCFVSSTFWNHGYEAPFSLECREVGEQCFYFYSLKCMVSVPELGQGTIRKIIATWRPQIP